MTGLLRAICISFILIPNAFAAGGVARVAVVIGKAALIRDGSSILLQKGMEVFETDTIETMARSAVKLSFTDGSVFTTLEDSKFKIDEYKNDNVNGTGVLRSTISLIKGKARFFVRPPSGDAQVRARFKTQNTILGIRGTSGFIDFSDQKSTRLVVFEGKVEAASIQSPDKFVLVLPNQFTDIVGRSVPTLPKTAPAAMLTSLNAETNKVDVLDNSKPGETGTPPAKPSNQPKEEKPEQKKESPSSGSKPTETLRRSAATFSPNDSRPQLDRESLPSSLAAAPIRVGTTVAAAPVVAANKEIGANSQNTSSSTPQAAAPVAAVPDTSQFTRNIDNVVQQISERRDTFIPLKKSAVDISFELPANP